MRFEGNATNASVVWILTILNEVLMKSSFFLIGAFAFSCLEGVVCANDIPPVPIDRQISQADLVVIGRLGENRSCDVQGARVRCAELIIDGVLKGAHEIPGLRRYILHSSGLGESRIDFLFVPTTSLIFMRRRDGEVYEPLYGDRSVFPLTVAR